MDIVESNKILGVAVLVTLPSIIIYLKRINYNSLLWGLLFIIAFTAGSLEIFGIPAGLSNILREFVIIVLAVKTFKRKNVKYQFPGIKYLLLFAFVAIFSALINNLNPLLLVLFFRKYFLIILFFYTVINYPFSYKSFISLDKLIIGLSLAQILANIIKYFIVGVAEPIIGTMSILGGGFTAIFGLVGIAFSISYYLVSNKTKFILLAAGFLLFSLIGGKRAMFVFAPMIILVSFFYYQKLFSKLNIKFFKNIFLIGIFVILSVYAVVRLNPTLNPDKAIGGAFSWEYLIEYSDWYLNEYEVGGINQSRAQSPLLVWELLKKQSVPQLFFGLGAGQFIESSLNMNLSKYSNYLDFLVQEYNIGYGAQTGYLQLLLQVGILGVLFYLLFFINLAKRTITLIKIKLKDTTDIYTGSKLLGIIGVMFIFFLMFIFYTQAVIDNYAPSLIMFWAIGYAFRPATSK